MKKSFFVGVCKIRKAYKVNHYMVLFMFKESYPPPSVVTSLL